MSEREKEKGRRRSTDDGQKGSFTSHQPCLDESCATDGSVFSHQVKGQAKQSAWPISCPRTVCYCSLWVRRPEVRETDAPPLVLIFPLSWAEKREGTVHLWYPLWWAIKSKAKYSCGCKFCFSLSTRQAVFWAPDKKMWDFLQTGKLLAECCTVCHSIIMHVWELDLSAMNLGILAS